MKTPSWLAKPGKFFITHIIVGLTVVAGLVAFTEWAGRWLLHSAPLSGDLESLILALADAVVAIAGYRVLVTHYEKRPVTELNTAAGGKYALAGFSTGLILQSSFIFVLYMTGGYFIESVNPLAVVIPVFSAAVTAGFVMEILIRGILFRLMEEKLGTALSLLGVTLLFGLVHMNVAGATLLSVLSTATEAGILLSAAYIWTRSLWFTIFFHLAWDFAEPGIFGAVNPGNRIEGSLLTGRISGSAALTGGSFGPQNSIQALLLCLAVALLFLWLAKRKRAFIKPSWKVNRFAGKAVSPDLPG